MGRLTFPVQDCQRCKKGFSVFTLGAEALHSWVLYSHIHIKRKKNLEFSCVCTFSCEQLCDNCLQRVLKVTCIRCAASAAARFYTQAVFTLVMCHLGERLCATPPPIPTPHRGPWEQIVFIRSRNVVLTGRRRARAGRPHPPAGASRTIPLLSVRFSSSFFFGVGSFSGSRCLPGYFVQEQACRTDI